MTTYQQYASAGWASSLDSFEGVPEMDVFEPRITPSRHSVRAALHEALNWFGVMLPGMSLALGLAWAGWVISEFAGRTFHYNAGASPISPVTLAVALGLIVRNTVGVPATYEPGLRLCMRGILRIGIVIMGLTLSIVTVGSDVLVALPVLICCITAAMVSVSFIARAMGISRRLGTLIAVGTSICGVSAIMATAPVIDADENETSYAAACITIFGLLAMITYPFLAHDLFTTPKQAGVFFGTAIHDMSQATAAGLAYAQQFKAEPAFHTAVSVKLVRNLFMSILIPLAGVLYHRGSDNKRRVRQKLHQIVPLFVVGFLLMACIRTAGDSTSGGGKAFGMIPVEQWNRVGAAAKFLVPWLLAMAMGAVGLGTGLAKLKNLGWKPFSVGFAAALMVGGVSTVMIKVVAPFLAH
jgi:uncharacterized integral membrane protein (TIGR00698 family)